ncbi:hypothetical protein MT356_01690 [Rathayibacter festucae]|uniref:hypothetical protein n=1 Tax=Rathayibacter festucae TaxID=110937 RepID=UPI001FB40730|nr:hypothetical protein [Rathayibacter festucae]MCJ1698415.1 hypothetical protein [Rathayibacter festucae]
MEQSAPQHPSTSAPLTRRALTGLAWSAPVVALAVATPAAATSQPIETVGLRILEPRIEAKPGETFPIRVQFLDAAGQGVIANLVITNGNGALMFSHPGYRGGDFDSTTYATTDQTGSATFTAELDSGTSPGQNYDYSVRSYGSTNIVTLGKVVIV